MGAGEASGEWMTAVAAGKSARPQLPDWWIALSAAGRLDGPSRFGQ